MANNVYKNKQYLDYLEKNIFEDILSPKVLEKYKKSLGIINNVMTDEVILETNLCRDDKIIDYSIKVDKKYISDLYEVISNDDFSDILGKSLIWTKIKKFSEFWKENLQDVDDIWFEVDYESVQDFVEPCFFINASNVYQNEKYQKYLINVMEKDVLNEIQENLQNCLNKLPEGVGLFQLGVMLSRKERAIRLFSNELSSKQLINYLKAINWKGDINYITELLEFFDKYSDKQYIVDFNVFSDNISTKIGINFGLDYEKDQNIVESFLLRLKEKNLCIDKKIQSIKEWTSYDKTNINRNISHFKFSIDKDQVYSKAYLRLLPNLIFESNLNKMALENKW